MKIIIKIIAVRIILYVIIKKILQSPRINRGLAMLSRSIYERLFRLKENHQACQPEVSSSTLLIVVK